MSKGRLMGELIRTRNRKTTCGLYGHSFEEFRDWYGDDSRLIKNYQIELYKFINEQIAAGMRDFVSLLKPGAALWMSDYILTQRATLYHLDLQLHIIYTKPASQYTDDLEKKVLHFADTATPIHSHRVLKQFRALMERSSRMLIVERSSDAGIFCSCAERAGIKVFRYAMTELI